MVTKRWKKDHEKLPRLVVDEPSGFRVINNKPVIILDELGNEFYSTDLLETTVTEFNLPIGTYYILQGKIAKMPEMVKYPINPLPKPERLMRDDPENFEIKFVENPFTGSVFWDVKKIYLDNGLCELPLPSLVFVLYHEYAHRYYVTESHCDLYAANRMLQEGYNPSQIGEGVVKTLSASNYARMEKVVNKLI